MLCCVRTDIVWQRLTELRTRLEFLATCVHDVLCRECVWAHTIFICLPLKCQHESICSLWNVNTKRVKGLKTQWRCFLEKTAPLWTKREIFSSLAFQWEWQQLAGEHHFYNSVLDGWSWLLRYKTPSRGCVFWWALNIVMLIFEHPDVSF